MTLSNFYNFSIAVPVVRVIATPPPTDPPDGIDPLSVDHIAPVVAWLGSPAAAHITGQVMVVYGGKVAIISAPSVEATFATAEVERRRIYGTERDVT